MRRALVIVGLSAGALLSRGCSSQPIPPCPDAATDDAGLPVACATADAATLTDGAAPDIQ